MAEGITHPRLNRFEAKLFFRDQQVKERMMLEVIWNEGLHYFDNSGEKAIVSVVEGISFGNFIDRNDAYNFPRWRRLAKKNQQMREESGNDRTDAQFLRIRALMLSGPVEEEVSSCVRNFSTMAR